MHMTTASSGLPTATVILCGGKGTRAYPHTLEVPKPLLEVSERPVLHHVMALYADQGYTRFVLAAGFKYELVSQFARTLPPSWEVEVVDTGENTNTGERIRLCRDLVEQTFFATYADGLADIDLERLAEFHGSHPGNATLTTVPLPSQYGTLDCDGDGRVRNFQEKPVLDDHWINAGFFVFDRAVFSHWEGEDLERDVLPTLGRRGDLYAYRHRGFWKSMDTYKDALELTKLCGGGHPPWTRSATPASS
jgi:glucose-1-phosphate cytidylyltransferase